MLGTYREVFAQNLRRLRGKRTQHEAAEFCGIPFVSYQRAENGDIPRDPNLSAIAKAYGLPEAHLFVDPSEFAPFRTSVPHLKMRAIELITRFDEPEPLEAAIALIEGMLGPEAFNEAQESMKKFSSSP